MSKNQFCSTDISRANVPSVVKGILLLISLPCAQCWALQESFTAAAVQPLTRGAAEPVHRQPQEVFLQDCWHSQHVSAGSTQVPEPCTGWAVSTELRQSDMQPNELSHNEGKGSFFCPCGKQTVRYCFTSSQCTNGVGPHKFHDHVINYQNWANSWLQPQNL